MSSTSSVNRCSVMRLALADMRFTCQCRYIRARRNSLIAWLACSSAGLNPTTGCLARRTAWASAGSSSTSRRRDSAARSPANWLITRRIVSFRSRVGGTSRLDRRACRSASPTSGRCEISSGPNSPARMPSSRSWL